MQNDPFIDPDGHPRRLRGACIYTGSPRLAELAGRLGFEAVWIEMEHGPSDFGQVELQCMAADAAGAVPAVRVPDAQRHHILRALEVGARLVVVPMVNDADTARQVVQHGKFPPLGQRGFNLRSRGLEYGAVPIPDCFERANQCTCLIAQVETTQAVEDLSQILAVPGLSGILIGPGDLSVALGCCGEMDNPKLIQTSISCIRQARAAGRHAGILVTPGPLLDAAIDAGADLLFITGDLTSLLPAWKAQLEATDALMSGDHK